MEETIKRLEDFFECTIEEAVDKFDSFPNPLVKELPVGLSNKEACTFNVLKQGYSVSELDSKEAKECLQDELQYFSFSEVPVDI